MVFCVTSYPDHFLFPNRTSINWLNNILIADNDTQHTTQWPIVVAIIKAMDRQGRVALMPSSSMSSTIKWMWLFGHLECWPSSLRLVMFFRFSGKSQYRNQSLSILSFFKRFIYLYLFFFSILFLQKCPERILQSINGQRSHECIAPASKNATVGIHPGIFGSIAGWGLVSLPVLCNNFPIRQSIYFDPVPSGSFRHITCGQLLVDPFGCKLNRLITSLSRFCARSSI